MKTINWRRNLIGQCRSLLMSPNFSQDHSDGRLDNIYQEFSVNGQSSRRTIANPRGSRGLMFASSTVWSQEGQEHFKCGGSREKRRISAMEENVSNSGCVFLQAAWWQWKEQERDLVINMRLSNGCSCGVLFIKQFVDLFLNKLVS